MSTYRTLLDLQGHQLDAHERAAIARLDARTDARKAFADNGRAEDPERATAGFLAFTRVFGQDPVALFGQESPALAYSRLTIRAAQRAEDGALEPGALLFEGRMSDRAITMLVLNSNQGQSKAAITAERLDELVLPPYVPPAQPEHDAAFDLARQQEGERLRTAMDGIDAALTAGLSAKARAKAVQALDHAARRFQDTGTLHFYLEQRIEAMSRRRVSFVSEAAHAALHAHHLEASAHQPRLPAPEAPAAFDPAQARAEHPVLDGALDTMEPDERAAVLKALRLVALSINAAEGGGREASFGLPEFQHWPRGQGAMGFSEASRSYLDRLETVAREALHPSPKRTAHTFTIGLSQVSGHTGHLHSSLPTQDGRYCTLRIEPAWMESSFGKAEIRSSHDPFITLAMSQDDLMMALRGHPLGAMTPCSFENVAGTYVPPLQEDRGSEQGTMARQTTHAVATSREMETLQEAMAALRAKLSESGTGKAVQAEVSELAARVRAAMEAYAERIDTDGYQNGAGAITSSVGALVRADLDAIHVALPSAALHKLLASS